MSKYDDILYLPHHVSPKRSPMSLYDRAAQFAPFAALTGYDGVIAETGRLTDSPINLDDGGKALLDEKLRLLECQLSQNPLVSFRCFRPDSRKTGGAYESIQGHVKKIDPVTRCILLEEGDLLPLDRITDLTWEGLPFFPGDGMIEENEPFPEGFYELPQG